MQIEEKVFRLRLTPKLVVPPSEPPRSVEVVGPVILNDRVFDPAKQLPVDEICVRVIALAQTLTEINFYPYQVSFGSRIIESLLLHDADVITSLMSRQSGKTQCLGGVVPAISLALPFLAKAFPDDWKLNITDDQGTYRGFGGGVNTGIYAPRLDQSEITFNRVKRAYETNTAKRVLREFGVIMAVNNGNTVILSNGSRILCESASEQSKIEGATHHLAIAEEAQDIGDVKLRRSISPMLASTMGCLTGDSLIEMGDGRQVRLDKLVNQKIESSVRALQDGRLKSLLHTSQIIEGFHSNGTAPCLRLVLQSGRELTCTYTHKFVCLHNIRRNQWHWITAASLKPGDRIAVSCEFRGEGVSETSTYPELLGYVLSEGYVKEKRVEIGSTNPVVRQEIASLAFAFDPLSTCVFRDRSIRIVKRFRNSGGPCNKQTLLQKQLVKDRVMGRGSYEKRVPPRCFAWNAEARARLLSTLFCGDGCFYANRFAGTSISYTTVSAGLAFDVQGLLSSLGIYSRKAPQRMFTPAGVEGIVFKVSIDEIYSQKEFLRLCGWRRDFLKYSRLRDKLMRTLGKTKILPVRFVKVKSIKSVGQKQTFDLQVANAHCYVANGIVAHNTLVQVGTAGTQKGDFYTTIKANERMEMLNGRRNHFFFPASVCSQYNSLYRKYIEKERVRIGENSDEFQMAYMGHWIFERGMFITQELLFSPEVAQVGGLWSEYHCVPDCIRLPGVLKHFSIVAGIDWGRQSDSTVVCLIAVDWLNPVDSGESQDSTGVHAFCFFKKHVIGWLEFRGDNYEYQFEEICSFFFRIPTLRKIIMDSNAAGAPLFDRFSAVFSNREVEVTPFNFQPRLKSDGYKTLSADLWAGRTTFPAGQEARKTSSYRIFVTQMLDLKKDYSSGLMQVAHPDERGARDDYGDALMLANWGASVPGMFFTPGTEGDGRNPLLS